MVNLKKIEKALKKLKTDKEKLDYLTSLLGKLDDKKDKELIDIVTSLIKELEKREEGGIERIAESAPSITRQREEIIEDIETDYAPLQPVEPLIIPQAPNQEEAEGITYEGTTEYTPLETSDVVYTNLSMEGAIEQTPLERNPIHERVERRLRDERLIREGQLELTSEEKQALKGRVAEITTMEERELTEYVDQLSERGLQEYELNKEFEEKTDPAKKYIKIEDKGR